MWVRSNLIRICWKKKCYNPFQIYEYFKYSSYSRLSLSQTPKSVQLDGKWDCMCYIWFHTVGFLKSVRVSQTIISQIYFTNKIKNFGKSVSFKYRIDDFAGLNLFRKWFSLYAMLKNISIPGLEMVCSNGIPAIYQCAVQPF